jgi:hypothetical protein
MKCIGLQTCCQSTVALLSALFLCSLHANAESKTNFSAHGFALLDTGLTSVRTDRLNRDNFFEISSVTENINVLLEGQVLGVSYRVRTQTEKAFDPVKAVNNSYSIQELNKTFKISDSTSLSFGKRVYSLDQSYIGQPLGFFQKQTDLSDPVDSLGRSEGLPMLALNWIGERAFATAIYSKDIHSSADGYNRGLRQWLLRGGYEFDGAGVALVLRRADGESVGVGGTISLTASESLGLYGSFYTAKGTQRPILLAVADGVPRFVNTSNEAIGFSRSNDGIAYPRFAFGAIYTPRELPKIQIELIYDRRGLSDRQYNDFLNLVRLHESGAQLGFPDDYVKSNLAYDSEILISKGARRKYISLSADHSFGDLAANCGVYAGVADWSALYYCSVNYNINNNINLSVSETSFRGSNDSERHLLPVASSFTVRLKWLF